MLERQKTTKWRDFLGIASKSTSASQPQCPAADARGSGAKAAVAGAETRATRATTAAHTTSNLYPRTDVQLLQFVLRQTVDRAISRQCREMVSAYRCRSLCCARSAAVCFDRLLISCLSYRYSRLQVVESFVWTQTVTRPNLRLKRWIAL